MEYKDWLYNKAEGLREHPTGVEWIIGRYLKKRKIKYEFQVPIMVGENKGYIADFVFFKRVVLEVDGTIHNTPEVKERDREKEIALKKNGYRVVRVSNADILKNCGTTMADAIRKIAPSLYKQKVRKTIKTNNAKAT